jgi:hypothetical protein
MGFRPASNERRRRPNRRSRPTATVAAAAHQQRAHRRQSRLPPGRKDAAFGAASKNPERSHEIRIGSLLYTNLRKQDEKQPRYTNLTRLKTFVNLQIEIHSLHSSPPLIFDPRNERILS